MNARNLLYIHPHNPKKATSFADNKLKTKAFLSARGIPVAKLYGRIESREQLHQFDFSVLPDHCVLKPNFGFGGEGIVLLKGRDKAGNFLKGGKEVFTRQDLIEHIEDILDGRFSLGGRKDTAFFEQILTVHDSLAPFRPVGLPDIRVIVFNYVPVMAMLRIPTAESEGKANTHLGGIGIGIDISKGVTNYATQYNSRVHTLPYGGSPSGIHIPYWDDILLISSKIQQVTGIGYLAVDFTLDQDMGPAVLEVNARAGLMVQIANLAPLRARLERVQGLQVTSPEKGVRIGQELFGNKVQGSEEVAQEQSSKPILGLEELVTIVGDGSSIEQMAQINPTEQRSYISADILETVLPLLEKEESRQQIYRAKLVVGGQKIQTVLRVTNTPLAHPIVLGKRDVSTFLLDPTKEQKGVPDVPAIAVKSDLRAVDKRFAAIDKELQLLKLLKPINLQDEMDRLYQDEEYNPIFNYKPLSIDTVDISKRLQRESLDDSPLGILLQKKRDEMLYKLQLLDARGVDESAFTEAAYLLFGKPSSSVVRAAEAMVFNRLACDLPDESEDLLPAEKARESLAEVLDRYGLHNWKVVVREGVVAAVTVGGNSVYIRSGAKFSQKRLQALIAHEIETHVLTAENGGNQPYELLRRGFANYIETQEGLAVYNQNKVYGPGDDKYYTSAFNVLGVAYGLEHSFAETRAYFEHELGYTKQKSIAQSITIKRGLTNTQLAGGFTKGLVYFRGARSIEKFVNSGGDLADLYVGKIALEDLDLVKQIPDIQAPLLLPEWLRG